MKDNHDSHVFFVTAQGYAGDHWYSWFCKALNAHPEVFAYLANEGSRPKYFYERSRAERPDILVFIKFISDVGRIYTAIGDCYSYRAYHMKRVIQQYGDEIRWINVIRHPIAWLFFYVRWRATNMRMDSGDILPIEHEWACVDHELYKGLRPYKKNDVHIWAFYRGLTFLETELQRDLSIECKHVRLEDLVASPAKFNAAVRYLSHDRLSFDDQLLKLIFSWRYKPFRGEEKIHITPEMYRRSWEEWQEEAFHKLVSKKSIERFSQYGYTL